MPANECIAFFDPGNDLNAQTTGAVTGSRFVAVSGVIQAGSAGLASDVLGGNLLVAQCSVSGQKAIGVASMDAASGEKLEVIRGHKVVPVTAGAAMTAGDEVMTDASGRAITWSSAASEANRKLGTVLNSPGAAGQTAIVVLNI